MAIDLRANASCSLGPLISASISDDYIQENGLIKTKGSCVIDGIVRPDPGTTVTFSYTKNGQSYNIPRILRVLSSFADPYRNTTNVELGCKLTYLEDVKSPIDWDALAQQGNEAFTEEDKELVIIPITALQVASRCLLELGITLASPSTLPLTNRFSISEFDFSSGFVNVLSDLLVSESFCGYLNYDEELVIIDLSIDQDITAAVLPEDNIIDVSQINVGSLPGDSVIVSYSFNEYIFPDVVEEAAEEPSSGVSIEEPDQEPELQPREIIDYTVTKTEGPIEYYFVQKENIDANGERTILLREYAGASRSESYINYYTYDFIDTETGELSSRDVAKEKFDKNYGPSIADAGSIAQDYFDKDESYNSIDIQRSGTNTYYTYDIYGRVLTEEVETYNTLLSVVSGLSVNFAFLIPIANGPTTSYITDLLIVDPGLVLTGYQYTKYRYFGDLQQKITNEWKLYPLTQRGQQLFGISNDLLSPNNSSETGDLIDKFLPSVSSAGGINTELFINGAENLTYIGQTVDIDYTARIVPEKLKQEDLLKDSGGGTSSTKGEGSGITQGSSSEIILASGSLLAERRVEFSMPYADDESFVKTYLLYNGQYYVQYKIAPSKAAQKAKQYGIIQNRLLLGNRSGMNVQVAPELLPESPFDPIVVTVKNVSALYRMNGTTWQIDSFGILAATDALFWGGVGSTTVPGEPTGDIWFPLAPGVTALPTSPAVVDGTMQVDYVVPPWNQINVIDLAAKAILAVRSFKYSLEPSVTEVDLAARSVIESYRYTLLEIPQVIQTTINYGTPRVQGSTKVNIPVVSGFDSITTGIPRIQSSSAVRPIAINLTINTNVPSVGSQIGTFIKPSATNITVLAKDNIAVGNQVGTFVSPPSSAVIITPLTPTVS